jgi:hypothetical protein
MLGLPNRYAHLGKELTLCLMIAPRPLLSLLIIIVSFGYYSYANMHCIGIGGLA